MAFDRRIPITLLLRSLLGLILLCVIALALAAWWIPRHGEAWLDRTLRERIAEIIDEASVEGYHFAMKDLTTDVRNGRSHHHRRTFGFRSAVVGQFA